MTALATERIRHGVWKRDGDMDFGDHSNEGLRRLDTLYRRQLEDIESGDLNPRLRRSVEGNLAALEAEISLRVMLQRRYGARPDGMDQPSADDEPMHHPPSYWLALVLDYRAWRRGWESLIDWAVLEAKHGRLATLDFLALDGEIVLALASAEAQ